MSRFHISVLESPWTIMLDFLSIYLIFHLFSFFFFSPSFFEGFVFSFHDNASSIIFFYFHIFNICKTAKGTSKAADCRCV